MRRILLVGNPNVGKSVVFSRLTAARAIASNYAGTTVDVARGRLYGADDEIEVLDVPGTYTLEPTCAAEKVAVDLIEEGGFVVNVLDATNLERNLYLTLELLEKSPPAIVVLNLWDEARRCNIEIDADALESILGVPVVPTVAVTGEGIEELISRAQRPTPAPRRAATGADRWAEVERILAAVQRDVPRRLGWRRVAQDLCVHPLFGFAIAVAVALLAFAVVRGVGEGLATRLLDPLFDGFHKPAMTKLSVLLGGKGFLHDVLIGELIDGEIDFRQSFGVLTTGLYVPIALVLPYVLSFYAVLSFLEDLGYLPRLAVLVDNLMRRMGLHGYAIISMILGLGCNVPGALATRVLESRRERFIAATLMAIGMPCMAQTAVIVGLVGVHGGRYVAMVFATLFAVWLVLGLALHRVLPGRRPELLVELPDFHVPRLDVLFGKVWMRVRGFVREAVPFVMVGILFVNILYALHIMDFIAWLAAPVVTELWGLPREAVMALVIGFLRKDVAVGMLGALDLTAAQLVVGCTVLALYFPCVATFATLLRELGARDMAKSALIMLSTAVVVGTLLNLLLGL